MIGILTPVAPLLLGVATWIDQRPEFPLAYRLRPRTAGLSLRYAFPDGG